MKTLVISCSLNPDSRSNILARQAVDNFRDLGHEIAYFDLREFPMPICDGYTASEDTNAQLLRQAVDKASVILLAVPIYIYGVNAAAKNLVELTGKAWNEKTVGFLCAAGGQSSYMSVMNFANSLMLNFRCLVVPRFVYCTGEDFTEDAIASDEVRLRVQDLCQTACDIARG